MLARMLMHWIVFALLLMGAIPAQAQDGTVYRGFIWGVSMDDVRRYEWAPFFEQVGDSLVFVQELDGRRSLIQYDFNKDRLWRIKHEYVGLNYSTTDKVLDVVMEDKAMLTARFGQPVSENLAWKYPLYRNHPKFFTRAYASGHVKIEAEWQKGDTIARMYSMKGEEDFDLVYTLQSRSIGHDVERQRTYQSYQGLN